MGNIRDTEMTKYRCAGWRTIPLMIAITMAAVLSTDACSAQQESAPLPKAPAAEKQDAVPFQPFREALLDGEWKVVKVKFAGRDLPEEDLRTMRLSVDGRSWQNTANGASESGEFEFPETKTGEAQLVNLVIEKGESAGTTLEGIIRQGESGFDVCYAVSGERPRHFESNEGSMNLLISYARLK